MEPQCSFIPSRGKYTGLRCQKDACDKGLCREHLRNRNPKKVEIAEDRRISVVGVPHKKLEYSEAIEKMHQVFLRRDMPSSHFLNHSALSVADTQIMKDCYDCIMSEANKEQPNIMNAKRAHRYLYTTYPADYNEFVWNRIWQAK